MHILSSWILRSDRSAITRVILIYCHIVTIFISFTLMIESNSAEVHLKIGEIEE